MGRLESRRRDLGVLLEVGHMDRRTVEDRAARVSAAIESPWELPAHDVQGRRRPVVLRDEMELLSVKSEHRAEETVAQVDRAPNDRNEHGLDIRGRAADHPKDLARRRLLLEGLGQVAVPSLQL